MLRTGTRTLGLLGAVLLATCSSPSEPERVPVVQLREHSVTIAVGGTFQAALLPMLPPGYVPPVAWASSHPSIATVAPTGSTSADITGQRAGEAVIRVAGEGARDSLRVTVISGNPG